MKELVRLQKESQITVQPCDKGAGIIVLDFDEYIRSCEDHLNSKLNETTNYYTKVNSKTIEVAKSKLKLVLEEGLNNEMITKEEYNAMKPDDKKPGKFYCTYKVHKEHTEGKAPPVRPITSGNGSITENLSFFVEHHIKENATKHSLYLKDTPDFLRSIEEF